MMTAEKYCLLEDGPSFKKVPNCFISRREKKRKEKKKPKTEQKTQTKTKKTPNQTKQENPSTLCRLIS